MNVYSGSLCDRRKINNLDSELCIKVIDGMITFSQSGASRRTVPAAPGAPRSPHPPLLPSQAAQTTTYPRSGEY
jgi:hypothetical protein